MFAHAGTTPMDHILAALFASKARAAIIHVLLLDPYRAYYQRQVERITGLSIRAVQRELDRLVSMGLFYRREEGNRTYYHVDRAFVVFDELRSMVLKTAEPVARLRGRIAMDGAVRQAFLGPDGVHVLLVCEDGQRPVGWKEEGFTCEALTCADFVCCLSASPERVEPYLARGEDLLGRRDDILWRRIEEVGYNVAKRKGVA